MTLNVWVTGSRGFIGSHLVKSLMQQDFNVTCITNSNADKQDVHCVDYTRRESIKSAILAKGVPDILFHLGWGDMHDPQSPVHLNQNLSNTKNLIDEFYENGLKKFILIGSMNEYGSREGCLTENDPPIGRLTNYAKGKLEASRYGLEAASKHNKIFIHVRLSNTLGVVKRQSTLINQLYKSYCDSTALSLTACEQFRDYIYVSDAVDGLQKISNIDSSEIINLGGGGKILLRELVEIFWNKLGAPSDLLMFSAHERPSDEAVQPPCYASLDKLRRMTNWQPKVTIEEGISRTIDELEKRSQHMRQPREVSGNPGKTDS